MKGFNSLGIILVFWGLTCLQLKAQVNIIPTSSTIAEQFSLDDVFRINLANTSGGVLNGRLRAIITSADQQTIAEIYSGLLHLEAGALLTGRQINWQHTPRYGSTLASRQLQETGLLVAGSYAICYQFLNAQGANVLSDNCFEKEIRPLIALELLSPVDGEEISNIRPILTWQPLIAFSNAKQTTYGLKLVAINEGQTPERALAMNQVLIHESNLNSTFLPYPTTAFPLLDGKAYAWQVAAYKNGIEVGKTPVWQFIFQVPKETKTTPTPHPYCFANTSQSAEYYMAKNGVIHLAYDNRYNLPALIYDVNEPEIPTKQKLKLPVINLQPGLNFIDLQLKDITAQVGDFSLTIRIKDPNNDLYYLQVKAQQ